MNSEQALQDCVQSFVRRDYSTCAQKAAALLQSTASPELLRLFVISRIRSGQTERVPPLPQQAFAAIANDKWEQALLAVILGKATPQQVDPLATSEEKRGQLFYYLGDQLLTGDRPDDARMGFVACLLTLAPALERQLALADLASLSGSIEYLSEQFVHVYQQGRLKEAIKFASLACDVGRLVFSEDHPNFAGLLNNLAVAHDDANDHEVAEALFRRALEIGRRHGQEHTPKFATYLHGLAGVCYRTGRYQESEELNQQALTIRRATLGEEDPNFASSLNSLALVYYDQKRYTQAEPLFAQALKIERKTLGDRHTHTASTMANLGEMYHTMGRYDLAEKLLSEALEVRRATLGDRHERFIYNLNQLGRLLSAAGKYSQAERFLQQALALGRAHGSAGPAASAMYLNDLGLLYKRMGRYDLSEARYQEALESRKATLGDDHLDVAQSLSNLAELYRTTGQYARSEELLLEALAIDRRRSDRDRTAFASRLNNTGLLYHGLGRIAEAEKLLLEALDVDRRMKRENHPDAATHLHNLAHLYQTKGRYAEAVSCYRRALDVRLATLGPAHPDYASTLNNLASLYVGIDNHAQAITLYEQARRAAADSLGEGHFVYASIVNNEGMMWAELGELDRAEQLYERALTIRLAALGKAHPEVAQSLSNLGSLYVDTGRLDQAEPLLRQAAEAMREALGDAHPDYAVMLNNLANLYERRGQHEQARQWFTQSLQVLEKSLGPEHPSLAAILSNRAILDARAGRGDDALEDMKRAAAIDDGAIGEVFALGSESQRADFLRGIQTRVAGFLWLVWKHHQGSANAVLAAFNLVLRRKGLGAEALAVQRDAILGGRYPDLEPSLRALRDLKGKIARLSLDGPKAEDPREHRQQIAQLHSQKEQLEAELAQRIPELRLEHQLHVAHAQVVAGALEPGSALVEFVRTRGVRFGIQSEGPKGSFPARYLAFVLRAGDSASPRLIDLGEAEPIDRLVDSFRKWLLGSANPDTTRLSLLPEKGTVAGGEELQQILFGSVKDGLGDCRRIIIAPDGNLSLLPFEALPLAEGRLVIEDYEVSYLNCGRDILRFGRASSGHSTEPVVVADPAFNLTLAGAGLPSPADPVGKEDARLSRALGREMRFGPLKGTREEGERVAALLKVRPWLRADALDGRLKSRRSPRVLHLATHGFFLPDQPARTDTHSPWGGRFPDSVADPGKENPLLRSGLAMAGANIWLRGGAVPPEAEDGLLTAEDVTGMDLLDTELVVLSACETGLGEVQVGEGVFGLRRAFVLAGARTLIMSLWKVPDAQTRDLIMDFYARLDSGRSIPESLRAAQLAMMEKRRQPYNWAAFICQGEPSPSMYQSNH
jgi:tetratricopeptide (TPR) repeat protein/CHAT domain-containing protein